MACGDAIKAEQSRWSEPFRRIAKFGMGLPWPLRIATAVQPVIVVSDASYSSGKPGRRYGAWAAGSGQVVARRSVISIEAPRGPVSIDALTLTQSMYMAGPLPIATIRALYANLVEQVPFMASSGNDVVAGQVDPGCTAVVAIGDMAIAAFPAAPPAPLFTAPTGANPFPSYWFELKSGTAILLVGTADNTTMSGQVFLTEIADWGGGV